MRFLYRASRHLATALALVVAATGVAPTWGTEPAPTMVRVGPGVYYPLYPAVEEESEIAVEAFWLDRLPVTNREFLEFVTENPEWQIGKVPTLFAGESYLNTWQSATELGPGIDPEQPVVGVTWWAARAYCEARGADLPTENQWELAAAASEDKADAHDDPEHLAKILAWYGRPGSAPLPRVGVGEPNFWGVHDLHGVAWEWILDYNSALVSVDNREDGGADRLAFCGAGALKAKDKGDYAAFMRIAFRASLEARYATRNLGFRCARELGDRSEQ